MMSGSIKTLPVETIISVTYTAGWEKSPAAGEGEGMGDERSGLRKHERWKREGGRVKREAEGATRKEKEIEKRGGGRNAEED